jgi:DNA-binding transcriptional MerR regulator
MPKFDGYDYLSTGQIANIFSVTKNTVENWLKAKKIKEPRRHPTNHYRLWTENDIAAIRIWLDSPKEDGAND